MGVYLATGGALLLYLILAWFLGTALHLKGASLWVLRGGLAVIGLIAAGTFLWWWRTQRGGGAEVSVGGSDPELDALVREAANRLKTSRLGRGATLSNQPLFFLVGEPGTTKTTTVVNSGLEAELLAGQVFQDTAVVPTRIANFWYTRQGIFLDVGGTVLNQPERWHRLIKRVQPGRLASAVQRNQQAPRAIVVCVDVESFFTAGASENIPALARRLNTRLQEISQILGIALPVYVLFTKLDRLPSFADYVRTLSRDEATQVLGATVSMRLQAGGVYAEEETRRLSKAFDEVFYSLAEKRMEFLSRETEAERLGGVYEFPRDLRKLRNLLVQFLVDLGRPSQLRANPFLRGFYFSGVRAIFVEDAAPMASPAVAAEAGPDGATRMLSMSQLRAARAPAPARVGGARKVPQWVFLTRLLNDVVLKDRVAMGASGFSSKVSVVQRVLLAAAAALCLFVAVAFTVSFFANRSLESTVTEAAKTAASAQVSEGQLAPVESLQKLEALRQSVGKLATYEREGAPWHLRWGLYSGDRLYPAARKVYFTKFRELLLEPTQLNLLASMRVLPPSPGPTDEYGTNYDTLKAYLITTSNHEKSTQAFLSPVLLARWAAGRRLEPDHTELAQKQFDFYSEALAAENPYSSATDSAAVERARSFLSKFAGVERMYRFMLDEASRKNPGIQFNRRFPGSAEVVVATREVEGAFTKGGWTFVQNAIAQADKFFAGEEWVLGPQTAGAVDQAKLQQELRARYLNDFIERWRALLRGAYVVRYAGPRDAARKLSTLAGNQSPLLALFWLVSDNTAVGSPEVTAAFQPVQFLVPPGGGGDRYLSPGNAPYMNGLVGLQTAIEQVASSPSGINDRAAVDQSRASAFNAKQAALQIAQGFTIDAVGKVDSMTKKLMEDPIRYAEGVIAAMGPAELNGKGRALCAMMRELWTKYPFNPSSQRPAAVAEMNAIFQPGAGALWGFYEQTLKTLLVRQGAEFVANPGAGVNFNPAFLSFFSRAMMFADTVYPGGSPQPRLAFTMRPYPVEGIQPLTLTISGQSMPAPGSPKQFTWQAGEMEQVRLTGRMGGTEFSFLTYSGPWAVFDFFYSAERMQSLGAVQSAEWVPKTSGQPFMVNGKPLTVRYDVEMSGAPVFQKGYLSGMRCVGEVAR